MITTERMRELAGRFGFTSDEELMRIEESCQRMDLAMAAIMIVLDELPVLEAGLVASAAAKVAETRLRHATQTQGENR